MRTEAQINAAAAAAAEKANGGKFIDPLFYKPEHQAFWRDVIRAALETADATPAGGESPKPKVLPKEVEEFRDHCVYIRSVYTFATRIWKESDAHERKTMETIAPLFFEDIGMVLGDFIIIAACRITDRTNAGRGRQNFTAELFVNSHPPESEAFKQLDALHKRMQKHRKIIEPARNKLGAHADRDVILKGEPLRAGSWDEWSDFWSALADFVRILNEQTFGKPFEIDAAGVLGDAEMLLKALTQSQHFEAALNSADPTVRDACLKLAIQNG
jgi:AbiU2